MSLVRVRLSDIAVLKRGTRVVREDLIGGGRYPVYQNSLKPMGYYSSYNNNANTTFVICAGAAGEIGYSEVPFWGADDCFSVLPIKDDVVKSKYLYYLLLFNKRRIMRKVRRASIPRLSRDNIEKLEVCLPSISTQDKIIAFLDEIIANNGELNKALFEEVEKNNKRVEYWIDNLMSGDKYWEKVKEEHE